MSGKGCGTVVRAHFLVLNVLYSLLKHEAYGCPVPSKYGVEEEVNDMVNSDNLFNDERQNGTDHYQLNKELESEFVKEYQRNISNEMQSF